MDDTAQKDDKIVTGQGQYVPSGSSSNKEKMPVATAPENIKPSEEEPQLSEELQKAGVSVTSDKPKLDEIHEQIGVRASGESTPVSTSSTGAVSLPMTEQEADETLKKKGSKFNLHENVGEFSGEYTEDSLPFLASLIKKVFKEMHRRVFGKK